MLRLKSLRIISKLSRKELADKLGISTQTLAKYEQCVSVPSVEKIIEISNIFGVTVDYLIGNDKPPIPVIENKSLSIGEKLDLLLNDFKKDIIREIKEELRNEK